MKSLQTMFYPKADDMSASQAARESSFVAYVERYSDVHNPFDLKELAHKKICQVLTAVIKDGAVVQVLALKGSCVVDDRYMTN